MRAGDLLLPIALAVPGLLSLPSATADEPTPSDLTEEVRVRYVLLDALVLDARGNVVPDLGIDDFKLYVDWKPYPIATVDVQCPEEGGDRAARSRPRRPAPESADSVPRRVVLALDYRYVPQIGRVAVIEQLENMIRDREDPLEPVMIAALTRRLRVEQPFTSDRAEILGTLARMKRDASLWQESPYAPLHAVRWLESLEDLVELLGDFDGLKTVVLFSDLPSNGGPHDFGYQPQLEAISAAATEARTAIYAAQAGGLTVQPTSDRLARLAVDTGGRFVANTNDLSRAYDAAVREMACRYAIGFYDRELDRERVHRVSLSVGGEGLRVYNPSHYRFVTDEERERRRRDRAYVAPAAFVDDEVRGELLPIRPVSRGVWEAAVVMRFAAGTTGEDEHVVDFGFLVDDPAHRPVRSADHTLTLARSREERRVRVVAVDRVEIEPGAYDLSVVVTDPASDEPRSSFARVELPAIPRRGVVAGRPLLTRPSGEDVATSWSDGLLPRPDGAELVEDGAVVADEPLTAVTRVCRVGRRRKSSPPVVVERTLRDADGAIVREFSSEADLAGDATVRCETLEDVLPTVALDGGRYRFDVALGEPPEPVAPERGVAFRLEPVAPGEVVPSASVPAPREERPLEIATVAPARVIEGRRFPFPPREAEAATEAAPRSAPSATDLPPLDLVLDRLTDVADLYRSNALRFTADEKTTFRNILDTRSLPGKMQMWNIYFYYLNEAGVPQDRRIRKSAMKKLKKRGTTREDILEDTDTALGPLEGNYGIRGRLAIPYYIERPYSWIQLFSRESRREYSYHLEPADEPGRVVVRFEPKAVDYDDEAWFGTALVDLRTFQIVRGEGMQGEDRREELAMQAMLASPYDAPLRVGDRTFVTRVVSTEFDAVYRDLRFPSRARVVVYRHRVRGPAEDKDQLTQVAAEVTHTYDNYRFYEVKVQTDFARGAPASK